MKFLRLTSHHCYQHHLLQQLPKFLQAPPEIFACRRANGHDSSNGSGIGISIESSVDFLVELSRLGQGNGLLAPPKGDDGPRAGKNWSPKGGGVFWGISFLLVV